MMFERTRKLIRRLAGEETAESRERRSTERYPSEHATRIRPADGGADMMARIQDVSRGGIRLIVDQPVPSGAMIHIQLPSPNHDPHTMVMACVVHSRPTHHGSYALGCSFSTDLNDTDLSLLAAKKAPPPQPSRANPRAEQVNGRATYRRVEQDEERRSATIHNLSLGGVALKVSDEFEPGTLLDLELVDHSGTKRVTMVACVVYRTDLEEGHWLVGCNFVRELDDEDLRALIGTAR
jgi:hypothetical protein